MGATTKVRSATLVMNLLVVDNTRGKVLGNSSLHRRDVTNTDEGSTHQFYDASAPFT